VIKCGVCGSENEAAALFCGVCGSPLKPPDATEVVPDARPAVAAATPTDESVVPGQGVARRDLGTGTPGGTASPRPATPTEAVTTDTAETTGPSITCSVCGTVNDAARTYCRKCANELKPAAAGPAVVTAAPPRRGIPPILLGLAAAGLVLLLGLGAILALGGRGPSPSASQGAQASTPAGSAPLATPAGSAPVEPTDPPFDEGDPEGRIVFARCSPDEGCVLVMINADGSDEEELTDVDEDGSATDPGFANDGVQVVFSTEGGLRILNVDTGQVSDHSTGPTDANGAWSPDDSMLAFAAMRARDPGGQNEDLEIRLDTVSEATPSEPLTSNRIEDHDPVFADDGNAIIWVQGRGDRRELLLMDLESRRVTDLTSDEFNDVDPAVSPDGTQIVFASTRGDGAEFDLFLMDLESKEITPLPTMDGDEHDPAWSPGGRYIVFSGGDSGSSDLYLLDLADESIDPLTEGDERDLAPAWRE
jgi:Tol biopolymer transport system component